MGCGILGWLGLIGLLGVKDLKTNFEAELVKLMKDLTRPFSACSRVGAELGNPFGGELL